MTPEEKKRVDDLVHAYELGMLSDADREWLELRMMDDDELFQRIQNLEGAAGIMRNDADIPQTVSDVVAEHDRKQRESERPVSSYRRIWKTLIPITALFLLVLLLKDWQFTISPTNPVFADENRVAILPFSVLQPDSLYPNFGTIIASLLISDLSESRQLNVVSSDWMIEMGRRIRGGAGKERTDQWSEAIARKAKAKWLVRGDVIATTPNVIVTLQIVDAESGVVLAGDKISDGTYKDIFSLVDSMTVLIRSRILPSNRADTESDPRIAEVTTNSPDAYFAYVEGLSLLERYYNDEAVRQFERAIQFDSTFAMAYYYLGRLKDRAYLDKAMRYIDKAGTRDKFYIRSLDAAVRGDANVYMGELQRLAERFPDEKYAYYSMAQVYYSRGNNSKARLNLDRALEIDSLYKQAYNLLAYVCDASGDFENAIIAINTYISMAPDEPNPYDTRADLYAKNGQLEKAIQSYKRALDIKPDYYASLHKLGSMYLYEGRYAEADSCYSLCIEKNIDNTTYRLNEELFRSVILYHQGRLSEAVASFDSLMIRFGQELPETKPSSICRLKAFAQLRQGQYREARRTFEQFLEMNKQNVPTAIVNDRHFYIQILAAGGEFAAADSVFQQMKRDLDSLAEATYQYWYALGAVDFYRENYKGAILNFEKAFELNKQMPTAFMLGRSYLEAGILDKAVNLFESQIKIYDESWRICLADWGILEHYYLAIAYQESNWTDKAASEFRVFLNLWKNSDKGIAEVEDARRRLKELAGES